MGEQFEVEETEKWKSILCSSNIFDEAITWHSLKVRIQRVNDVVVVRKDIEHQNDNGHWCMLLAAFDKALQLRNDFSK